MDGKSCVSCVAEISLLLHSSRPRPSRRAIQDSSRGPAAAMLRILSDRGEKLLISVEQELQFSLSWCDMPGSLRQCWCAVPDPIVGAPEAVVSVVFLISNPNFHLRATNVPLFTAHQSSFLPPKPPSNSSSSPQLSSSAPNDQASQAFSIPSSSVQGPVPFSPNLAE